MKIYESLSEEETIRIGKKIAKFLNKNSIVTVSGELGSGKTYLIKGICSYFGIKEEDVSSPSFTVLNIYENENIKIFHLDLYRIGKEEGEEIIAEFEGKGLILVEWGEKISKENFNAKIYTIKIKESNEKRVIKFNENEA